MIEKYEIYKDTLYADMLSDDRANLGIIKQPEEPTIGECIYELKQKVIELEERIKVLEEIK